MPKAGQLHPPQLQREPTEGSKTAALSAPSRCSISGQRQLNLQHLPPQCHAPCARSATRGRLRLLSDGAQPQTAAPLTHSYFAVGVRWRVWTRDMGFPVNVGDAALRNEGHAASAGSSRLLTWDGGGMEMLRHSLPARFPLPSKKEE